MRKMTSNTNAMRQELAHHYGLLTSDVRCYHCQQWGYNHGEAMNSMGESRCPLLKTKDNKTASYQWCKHFVYVGNSQ